MIRQCSLVAMFLCGIQELQPLDTRGLNVNLKRSPGFSTTKSTAKKEEAPTTSEKLALQTAFPSNKEIISLSSSLQLFSVAKCGVAHSLSQDWKWYFSFSLQGNNSWTFLVVLLFFLLLRKNNWSNNGSISAKRFQTKRQLKFWLWHATILAWKKLSGSSILTCCNQRPKETGLIRLSFTLLITVAKASFEIKQNTVQPIIACELLSILRTKQRRFAFLQPQRSIMSNTEHLERQ